MMKYFARFIKLHKSWLPVYYSFLRDAVFHNRHTMMFHLRFCVIIQTASALFLLFDLFNMHENMRRNGIVGISEQLFSCVVI